MQAKGLKDDGSKGWFPHNFVKEADARSPTISKPSHKSVPRTPSPTLARRGGGSPGPHRPVSLQSASMANPRSATMIDRRDRSPPRTRREPPKKIIPGTISVYVYVCVGGCACMCVWEKEGRGIGHLHS